MPPQHGKSELSCRWFPSWYLGKFPNHRIMLTSYADRFAQKWGRRCRAAMVLAGSLFGLTLSMEKAEAREWELEGGFEGSMFSAGVRGESTGRPADLLIVDDLHKNAEEAASETIRERVWDGLTSNFLTRLSNHGKVVAVGTRWHAEDAIGRMKAKWTDEGVPFLEVNFPALAGVADPLGRSEGEPLCPQLKSEKFLSEQKRTLSAYRWNALYGGQPSQHERAEFPDSYFGPHLWVDGIPQNVQPRVVAIDPSKGKNAKRGDYFACVFGGQAHGRVYVDARIERCPVGRGVQNALELCFRYGATHLVYEANQFQEEAVGGEIARQLAGNRLHGITVVPFVNTTSKEGRIQSLDPFLKVDAAQGLAGEVRFVDNSHTRLLVGQLKEFPMGMHDDGPDALEMMIRQSLALLTPRTTDNPTAAILAARGHV